MLQRQTISDELLGQSEKRAKAMFDSIEKTESHLDYGRRPWRWPQCGGDGILEERSDGNPATREDEAIRS